MLSIAPQWHQTNSGCAFPWHSMAGLQARSRQPFLIIPYGLTASLLDGYYILTWILISSHVPCSVRQLLCPPPTQKKKNPQKTYTKLLFGETSIRNPCFFPYHHPLFYLLNPNPSPLGSVSVHLLFKPEMNQVKNSIGPSGKATEYFGGYYYHRSFPWSDLHHGTTNSWISTKYQCNLGGIFFMVLKLLGAYWLLQAPLSPVFHWNRAGLIQSQFCSHQQSSNSCIFEGKLGWRGNIWSAYIILIWSASVLWPRQVHCTTSWSNMMAQATRGCEQESSIKMRISRLSSRSTILSSLLMTVLHHSKTFLKNIFTGQTQKLAGNFLVKCFSTGG